MPSPSSSKCGFGLRCLITFSTFAQVFHTPAPHQGQQHRPSPPPPPTRPLSQSSIRFQVLCPGKHKHLFTSDGRQLPLCKCIRRRTPRLSSHWPPPAAGTHRLRPPSRSPESPLQRSSCQEWLQLPYQAPTPQLRQIHCVGNSSRDTWPKFHYF